MKKAMQIFLIGCCFLALPLRGQINLLHEFAGGTSDGKYPWGDLIISGSTLYGMTQQGGINNKGTIFKVQIDGSGFVLLHEFSGSSVDGQFPLGSLILSGSTLYGVTHGGQFDDFGTVFKMQTDGSGFTVLHKFEYTSGALYPCGTPILSGSTLYGMTESGNPGSGTIFKLETDGTEFSLLHTFTGGTTDGSVPKGSLVISGSNLFGMTYSGGNMSKGTIFKIQTDGSNYSLLHEFSGDVTDGGWPEGSLLLSGSTLYGMTSYGQTGQGGPGDPRALGTIFKINTDGSEFVLLYAFPFPFNADAGLQPHGSLILSGSTLYGMTHGDGETSYGTLFQIGTDGTGFSLLHTFTGTSDDGKYPEGSLLLSDSILHGMTKKGGDNDFGVVFSLALEGVKHNVSGTIANEGLGLEGVLLNGLPGNPVTNSSGFYSVDVDHFWSGTATPTLQYFVFSPSSMTYSNIAVDQTTNYSATLSQSLVVTAPFAALAWERGRTYPITWLKQGAQNAYVKINLYKGNSVLVKTLTTKTANDGAFEWLVPASLPVGNTYFIRVQTIDNLIRDDSDRFSIITPTITVTSPAAGSVWLKGTSRVITWNKQGTQDDQVRIQLFKGTALALNIAASAANNGMFDWSIPATLANAANYAIRITTLDGKVKGASKSFTIASGLIHVTSPASGTHWQRGRAHAITWSGEGTLNASVKIQLFKGTNLLSTLAATTANDGSFEWTIPASQAAAANYKIRVISLGSQVRGDSVLFAITTSSY